MRANLKEATVRPGSSPSARASWFAAIFGAWLGLGLLKFGNPVILESLVTPPANWAEWLFESWPVAWGYGLLIAPVIAGSLFFTRQAPKFHATIFAPIPWFVWQWVAAFFSIDHELSRLTLLHFSSCLVCFYLGYFGLRCASGNGWFWGFLLAAFLCIAWSGLQQHYGGLEATRNAFYQQPDWRNYPPEYLKKIQSNRIFATLFYPNALAGAILLIAPGVLVAAWRLSDRWERQARMVWTGLIGYLAVALLYWTNSKAGWLIALTVCLVIILHQRMPNRLRIGLLAVIATGGLLAFGVKFAAYFQRGAPSASARLQYWRAAVLTAVAHPVVGTGPGTFSRAYARLKPAGAEMARLTHNDYLEQGSDSGIPGLLGYSGLLAGGLILLYRKSIRAFDRWAFSGFLGLLGFELQSFVEFGLYVPGVAWVAFALLGWGWAPGSRIESTLSPQTDTLRRTR